MRAICRTALKTIGVEWGDPPKNWLIHHRWEKRGKCPRDGTLLEHSEIDGQPVQRVVSSYRNGRNLDWLIVTVIPDSDGLHVLVVDDHPISRRLVCEYLDSWHI